MSLLTTRHSRSGRIPAQTPLWANGLRPRSGEHTCSLSPERAAQLSTGTDMHRPFRLGSLFEVPGAWTDGTSTSVKAVPTGDGLAPGLEYR